jgi:hypothetical protein
MNCTKKRHNTAPNHDCPNLQTPFILRVVGFSSKIGGLQSENAAVVRHISLIVMPCNLKTIEDENEI